MSFRFKFFIPLPGRLVALLCVLLAGGLYWKHSHQVHLQEESEKIWVQVTDRACREGIKQGGSSQVQFSYRNSTHWIEVPAGICGSTQVRETIQVYKHPIKDIYLYPIDLEKADLSMVYFFLKVALFALAFDWISLKIQQIKKELSTTPNTSTSGLSQRKP